MRGTKDFAWLNVGLELDLICSMVFPDLTAGQEYFLDGPLSFLLYQWVSVHSGFPAKDQLLSRWLWAHSGYTEIFLVSSYLIQEG